MPYSLPESDTTEPKETRLRSAFTIQAVRPWIDTAPSLTNTCASTRKRSANWAVRAFNDSPEIRAKTASQNAARTYSQQAVRLISCLQGPEM